MSTITDRQRLQRAASLASMGGPGGRPVEAGAASVVWAATLPDSGPTGGFFRDGKPLPW